MSIKIAVCVLLLGVLAINAAPQFKDQQGQKNNGGVSIDVNKERNEGTRVRVDGRQEIFNTNDGRTRGEAYGHWDRTYGGPKNGDRSHGGGVKIEHTWG